MNTTSTLNPLHELARSAAQALGLSSAWVLAAIVLAVLLVAFLAAFIVADVRRRHWHREADAKAEYLRGVEASAGMDLQPILSPDGRQVDSIVFQRVNAPINPLVAGVCEEDASAMDAEDDETPLSEEADTLERIRRLEQRLGRFDAEGGQGVAGAFSGAPVAGTANAPMPVPVPVSAQTPYFVPTAQMQGQAVPSAYPAAASAQMPVASQGASPVQVPLVQPAAFGRPVPDGAPGKTASFHIDSSSVTIVGRDGAPAVKGAAGSPGAGAGTPAGSADAASAGDAPQGAHAAAPYSTTSFPRVGATARPVQADPVQAKPVSAEPAHAADAAPQGAHAAAADAAADTPQGAHAVSADAFQGAHAVPEDTPASASVHADTPADSSASAGSAADTSTADAPAGPAAQAALADTRETKPDDSMGGRIPRI